MADNKAGSKDESEVGGKIYEIQVQEVLSDTFTVRANSRSEAFDAIEEPQDTEVQSAMVRKHFSSLSERRPVDGRHAPELEDYDDPDIDIDLTEQ